jgi:peptidoglycan hydrolase CwlO-like protein
MNKVQQIFTVVLLVFITISITSCDPSEKQLAKEKIRTEQSINAAVEPLKAEISSLKNEIKVAQLTSDLTLLQLKLDAIEHPKEYKTIGEQSSEITDLTAKIESTEAELSTLKK